MVGGVVGSVKPEENIGKPNTGTIKPGCKKLVPRHAATIGCAPRDAQVPPP